MQIILYKTASEDNRITKVLSDEKQFFGFLRAECSILTPTLEIETTENLCNFNYAFIEDFNRYYYITDIVGVSNNIWKISFRCDVLMSFNAQIRSLYANILRQKTDFNLMLEDKQLPTYADDRTQCFNFPFPLTSYSVSPSLDHANNFHYYLTVVGGDF